MINRCLVTGLQGPLSAASQTRPCRVRPFACNHPLLLSTTCSKGVPILLPFTINHYSRRNQSCENPILLFLLKIKLVFVSLLNYTIGGVCPFFSYFLPVFLRFFTFYFISFGHNFAVATIQFAYASYLFDVHLPTHPRNYDYGRWPRKTSPDLARILHMSSTSRKPSYSLRFDPPKLSSTQTSPCTESTLFR